MIERQRKAEYYNSIDGLRAFAAIGILLMHVKSNGGYELGNGIAEAIIGSFTDLVFLFMMVSSFSMCCGYFERVSEGKITPNEFYSKRFAKIWPFFTIVSVLELVVSFSLEAVCEVFANMTLCFGLLPNAKITVIGVGWTLGVIFVFYLLFPFFCALIENRKKVWLVLIVALIWNVVCRIYFFNEVHIGTGFSGRSNILYCAVYFVAGGVIYLYRDKIARWNSPVHQMILLAMIIAGMVSYFYMEDKTWILVITYGLVLSYAVTRGARKGVLSNPVVHFVSKISMEIYLCHMVIYRVIEKVGMTHFFASDIMSFFLTSCLTICGAVVFALSCNWGIVKVKRITKRNKT